MLNVRLLLGAPNNGAWLAVWAGPAPVLANRVMGSDRIREIDAWLNDHDVSVAAALDDDPSIRFRPWGVWVDPSRGLSRLEASAALAKLQAVATSAA